MKVISMTTIQLESDVKFSSVREHGGIIATMNLGGGVGRERAPAGPPAQGPGCGTRPPPSPPPPPLWEATPVTEEEAPGAPRERGGALAKTSKWERGRERGGRRGLGWVGDWGGTCVSLLTESGVAPAYGWAGRVAE